MNSNLVDRRTEKTRRALLDAFGSLFFEHGFEGFDIQDVAQKANVGRSTFYRHFRSKEDLLVQSLAPLFFQIAEACVSDEDAEGLRFVCQHFWDNRRLARGVFAGRSMILVVRALCAQIEQRLSALRSSERFPISLVAAQIASGHMAMLDDWLRGRGSSTPVEMATALHRSGRAVVNSLLVPTV